MKILIFSRDKMHRGGVVNYVNTLIKILSDKIYFERLYIGKRIGSKNLLLEALMPIFDCANLMKKMNKNKFDVIHLNPSFNSKAIIREGLFLIVLRIIKCDPIIIFWHGWNEKLAYIIKQSSLLCFLFNKVFNNSSIILVLSKSFKNDLKQIGIPSSKIRVTTTMFDGGIFEKIGNKNLKPEKNILFLSRLIREKGVYELLEAFELVSLKYPEIHLIIAGDGPELPEMKACVIGNARLNGRVTFTGYITDKDKGNVLLSSKIFVFPTYHGEGCPVSLLEAMAAGLAIVTTPVAAISDIVEHNVNGLLIKNVKPETIAQAIFRFLEDKNFFSNVQENNRRKAWENYETEKVSIKMEEIYREVVEMNS